MSGKYLVNYLKLFQKAILSKWNQLFQNEGGRVFTLPMEEDKVLVLLVGGREAIAVLHWAMLYPNPRLSIFMCS